MDELGNPKDKRPSSEYKVSTQKVKSGKTGRWDSYMVKNIWEGFEEWRPLSLCWDLEMLACFVRCHPKRDS